MLNLLYWELAFILHYPPIYLLILEQLYQSSNLYNAKIAYAFVTVSHKCFGLNISDVCITIAKSWDYSNEWLYNNNNKIFTTKGIFAV